MKNNTSEGRDPNLGYGPNETSRSEQCYGDIDLAAVFGCAVSLQRACLKLEIDDPAFNISESFNGVDQFMREIMRVGEIFEIWSIGHVQFDELDGVWPYLLEEDFGAAYLSVLRPEMLLGFCNVHCLKVAARLKLPLKESSGVPIPLDISRPNPQFGFRFDHFQILAVRENQTTGEVRSFSDGDELEDETFGEVFYGLYGVKDGEAEHIADRGSYQDLRNLAQALVPNIGFPESPDS